MADTTAQAATDPWATATTGIPATPPLTVPVSPYGQRSLLSDPNKSLGHVLPALARHYCVLALILGSLLQRRAAQNGLSLSLQALLKSPNEIREVTNVFPPAGKPGSPGRPYVKTTLTEMDHTQEELFHLFALDRYRQT